MFMPIIPPIHPVTTAITPFINKYLSTVNPLINNALREKIIKKYNIPTRPPLNQPLLFTFYEIKIAPDVIPTIIIIEFINGIISSESFVYVSIRVNNSISIIVNISPIIVPLTISIK